MEIIKAHAVNNLCYKANKKMTPRGIVLHSTGANNPNLKRYVDCPDKLGKNLYQNHWNTPMPGGRKVCVHAFIGYDKDKKIKVAEILPLNICCWGVGSGNKGSYNYSPPHIQIEICEDGLKDTAYYDGAFKVAAKYCAHLCKKFGLGADKIVSHREAHKKGYGSNHGDPEHWMKNFGQTMDDFRKEVSLLLNEEPKQQSKTDKTQIKDGDLVSIKSNAVYYSGKPIPSWVKSQNWYVKGTPKGDRVVIDKNQKGTNSICSPISAKFLTVVTPSKQNPCPYRVRLISDTVYIHKDAGSKTLKVGKITDKGVYTIIEEKLDSANSLWGKLKSGAGWIPLSIAKKL